MGVCGGTKSAVSVEAPLETHHLLMESLDGIICIGYVLLLTEKNVGTQGGSGTKFWVRG